MDHEQTPKLINIKTNGERRALAPPNDKFYPGNSQGTDTRNARIGYFWGNSRGRDFNIDCKLQRLADYSKAQSRVW